MEDKQYYINRYHDGITNDDFVSPNGAGIYDCSNIDINTSSRKITLAKHSRTSQNSLGWEPRFIEYNPTLADAMVWVVASGWTSYIKNEDWTILWTFADTDSADSIQSIVSFPSTISATNYQYVVLTSRDKVYFLNSNITASSESTVTLPSYSWTYRTAFSDGGNLYIGAWSYFLSMSPTGVVTSRFRIKASEYIVWILQVDTQIYIFANDNNGSYSAIYRWNKSDTSFSGRNEFEDIIFKWAVARGNIIYGVWVDNSGNSIIFKTDGANTPIIYKALWTKWALVRDVSMNSIACVNGFIYICAWLAPENGTINNSILRYGSFYPELNESLSRVYDTWVQPTFWQFFITQWTGWRIYIAYSKWTDQSDWYVDSISTWYASTWYIETMPFLWDFAQQRKSGNKITIWVKTPANTSISIYTSVDWGAYSLVWTIDSTIIWTSLTKHEFNYPVAFYQIQFKVVLNRTSWVVSPEFYDLTMPYEIIQ